MSEMKKFNEPNYSTFDLGSVHRTTMDMGDLVPIACIPTIPGDSWDINVDSFIRGMPTIAPIVDKVDIKINHFYVPNRVLWRDFEKFISHADSWTNSQKLKMPTFRLDGLQGGNYKNGRLADYLGISEKLADGGASIYTDVNALPFAAYQKIYLDYYAPQRWINYLKKDNATWHTLGSLASLMEQFNEGSGGHLGLLQNHQFNNLRRVGWNHDYFTNALPEPTLGGDVRIPSFQEGSYLEIDQSGSEIPFDNTSTGMQNKSIFGTIRELRKSIAVQHFLEKMIVTGGRYIENMKVFFGQDIKNDMLVRSQYLGGDVIPLFVNEVESTADTPTAALGDLSGKPIGAGRGDVIKMYAEEFGYYMCIAHIVPKRSYADALDKDWFVKEPYDFFNPEFENIGDEAVFQYELTGNRYENDVFGYVPRYSHLKGRLDRFSGEMKHSLKHWHLGSFSTEFGASPFISPEFIECNPRTDIFNVPTEPDKFIATFQMNINARRKMQSQSIAGMARI